MEDAQTEELTEVNDLNNPKESEEDAEQNEEIEEISDDVKPPVKEVIYTEIDDEITSIYDKVRTSNLEDVYIVIPERAKILQSIVNIKILNRKAKENNKTIHFITSDKNGIYLAQQCGIQVFNKSNDDGKPALFSIHDEDDLLRITPLKAAVNSLEEENPTRLSEKKISISEIINSGKNKVKDKNPLSVTKMAMSKSKQKHKKSRLIKVSANRHALIGLIVISLFVLLVIIYIALPGVTIYLTPSASVIEKSVNITLADAEKNRVELDTRPFHTIASQPIKTTITTTINHFSTGKQFSDLATNASGPLTVFNSTNSDWPLIKQTRFQNEDGIIFRILDGVTVPPASSDGPGTIEVYVVADAADAFGMIVGERGNIEPGTFFLPGLKESSRSKVYGESFKPMEGGVTDFISYITLEDLDAAEKKLNDELIKNSSEELNLLVESESEKIGVDGKFKLLEGEGAIKLGNAKINIPRDLEGKKVNDFDLTGELEVSGVYYDHASMLEILKNELLLKKSPQKELLRINENSTSYRAFDWDDVNGKIKLTANIKGIEQYEIDPDKESGQRLIKKIREHIISMNIEDAKLYIQNLPEINKVEIDSWPVWAPTIPTLPDNIDFEVREAITVE